MDKKLYKGQNSMVSGVCSGIAEYFGVDETIVRIIYVLASIGSLGTGVIIYFILSWIIPERPHNRNDYYDAQSRTYEHKDN